MSDYEDYDDDYEYGDDNWIFVEDHYDEADELAEYTCPSPAWQAQEVESYDPYDYFEDLAYLSDSYYDRPREHRESGKKRKRVDMPKSSTSSNKKRRSEVVVWKTNSDLMGNVENAPLIQAGSRKPFALLKDWRQRFQASRGLAVDARASPDLEQEQNQSALTGDGFDLGDLQSIAGMLSGDALEKLKELLGAKGLDPEAVQAVMEDLASGKEREFGIDEEDSDTGAEAPAKEEEVLSTPVTMPEYDVSIPHRSLKRKPSLNGLESNGREPISKRRRDSLGNLGESGMESRLQKSSDELSSLKPRHKRKASVERPDPDTEDSGKRSKRTNERTKLDAQDEEPSPPPAHTDSTDVEPKRKSAIRSNTDTGNAKRVIKKAKVSSSASASATGKDSGTQKRTTRSQRKNY